MATYNWVIEWMDCKPVDGDLQNVVITAGWRCNGAEGEHTATVYGSCGFGQPSDPFTPYADLTLEQVLGWCWDNGVDKDAAESTLANQLQEQANPSVVKKPLPW